MTAGHYSGLSVFWSVPSVYLSDRAAAGGIAMVTALGSIAAALTPALLGWIKTHTGALSLGLQVSAGIIVLGGVVLLVGIPAAVSWRRPDPSHFTNCLHRPSIVARSLRLVAARRAPRDWSVQDR